MFFPASGVEVEFWIPPLLAFGISLVTSLGGVSGAFILLPLQVSILGYASPSVSATNHLFNVVATPGGIWQFCREGRMLWPLAGAILGGTLPGVILGVWIRLAYLPDPGRFKVFAGCVLLLVVLRLLLDLGGERDSIPPGPFTLSRVRRLKSAISFSFQEQTYEFSLPVVLTLSAAVGMVGGTYGVGGGAIIAPFLVTFLRLPVHVVAGPAILGTFVTSLAGVLLFETFAGYFPELAARPDWHLGLLFGSGGFFGILLGSRMQRHVSARLIKTILLICTAFVAIRYLA